MPDVRPGSLTRPQLEDLWRLKLEEVRTHYQAAAAHHRKLLQDGVEQHPASSMNGSDAMVRARRAEADALAEYMRVLQIFTDLTVHGKLPDEELPTSEAV